MFHTICQYFFAALPDGTIVTPHSYPKIIRKHKSFRKDHKLGPKSKWAWEFFLSYLFFPLVDIFVILPLPQVTKLILKVALLRFKCQSVLAFAVIPKLNESRVLDATQTLKSVFLFQYGLRVIRICSLLKNVTRASVNILSEATWANLFFFLLASRVLGAFWYLFSIERKTTCWVKVCKNQGVTCYLYCDDTMVLNPLQLINDYSCSTKTNNTAFDYGIYLLLMLESGGIISQALVCFINGDLDPSTLPCRLLSSFGQSLKTSTYVWEIYFSIVVSISGLVLFALFIGNIQTYLNSKAERVKEMKSNGQEIELWMDFHSLPKCLKTRFRKYQKYRWQETRGVDVGKFPQKLPRDLGRDTKSYLCLDALKKVLESHCNDERVLRAICDHLKPVFYIKDSIIFQKDDQLDEMFIITHGRVRTSTKIN
ncbi:putative cGMP-dependent kinase, Ion transport domain-containing protein [Rosa chinensis]|uniref:Putative cGMP-dependent kinase, Ion transport domain-containing protein n=1 Tax=Rosa chinensis TaxID=74649 RepID=A0A2P6R0R0_ROSCH|nr:putative cGMP-dependent kinase, Ion transport domain-containing protein [Rosa chinensis]